MKDVQVCTVFGMLRIPPLTAQLEKIALPKVVFPLWRTQATPNKGQSMLCDMYAYVCIIIYICISI